MNIDKTTFFALVATLAAGGAGGYVASEKQVFSKGPRAERDAAPTATTTAMARAAETTTLAASSTTATRDPAGLATASSAAVPAAPPPPTCDDSVGTPGDCPPVMSPVDEGGCGSYATQRCAEFKLAMKPKVAERAVDCLRKLTPAERCDRFRVNLCGHLALMSACAEDETTKPSAVAPLCENVVTTCATSNAPIGPTADDCRRTLVGLNDAGRQQTAECVKKHCGDKSLLGCEAVPTPAPAIRARALE